MKHTFLTVGCLLLITAATAQDVQNDKQRRESKHELSIYGLLGYSPVSYALDNGAGLGYTFNINPSLGIVTGVEMSVYGDETAPGNVSGEHVEGTGEQQLRFSYSLRNYREKQSVTMCYIPLMAQYSMPIDRGSACIYASFGLKFGFPARAKTEISPGTAAASGYYSHEGVSYANLPQHGFFTGAVLPDVKQDFDPGFQKSLILEVGARFALSSRINLYAGWYFGCGLNGVSTTNRRLLEYNSFSEEEFKYNSVSGSGLVSKANTLNAGLKLRVGFKL
ncbi:MAG: hypothetical protein LBL04_00910 [Bacteroidales bacterium]|jgi:hypothetical protein|nr:hypothetical protein [Bacteroidales bacterium]